jgi:hypothetical protein
MKEGCTCYFILAIYSANKQTLKDTTSRVEAYRLVVFSIPLRFKRLYYFSYQNNGSTP